MNKKDNIEQRAISECCDVYARVEGRGLTKYYVCLKCEKDCMVYFIGKEKK